MKNLLKTISLLIIIGVGLSSCQTASLMKRHYNKGYYVSRSHKAADVKQTEPTKIVVKPQSEEPKAEEGKVAVAEPWGEIDVIEKAQMNPSIQNESKPSKKVHKTKDIANAMGGARTIFEGVKSSPKNLFSGISANGDDVGREALSLLWILIVALLIIYIVGLIFDLFGLGPVFHLLGVIILVLLVLWLLRII